METVLEQEKQPSQINRENLTPQGENKRYFCLTLKEFTKPDGSPIRYFLVDENKTLIAGTHSEADIKLKEYGVGPKHLSLEKIRDFILINDLGSERETYVNGIRLLKNSSMFLRSGDELKLGKLTFIVLLIGTDEKAVKATSPIITKKIVQEKIAKAHKVEMKPEEKNIEPKKVEIKTEPIIKDEVLKVVEKEVKTYKDQIPNIIVRLFGTIFDFALTYLVYLQFRSSEGHQKILEFFEIVINGALSLSKNSLEFAPDSIIFVGVSLLIFYAAYMVFTTFILGVSLGQKVIGLQGGDTFVWNRVGGVIRILFGFFTTPFLIFDFVPHLLRRRSLKEKLSMTKIETGKFKLIPLNIIFLLVPFLALVLSSPFWENSKYQKLGEIIQYNTEIPSIDLSMVEGNAVIPVVSNYFKFSFDYVTSKDFVFYPGFELVKKGVFQRIHPLVKFFDVKNETLGQLHAERYIYIADDLLEAKDKIGHFAKFYPHLNNYLEENKKMIDRFKGQFGENKFPELNESVQQDYQNLIHDALSFSPRTLQKHLARGEYFLSGYSWLQRVLMKRYIPFSKKEDIKIQKINLGKEDFLLISSENTFGLKENALIEKYLFPLGTLNGILFQISLKETPHYEKAFMNFLTYFSYQLRFQFDNQTALSTDANIVSDFDSNRGSIFLISDYFASKEIQGGTRTKLEDYLFTTYVNFGKLSNEIKNEEFKESITNELSKIEGITKIVVKDFGPHEKYLADLKSLERAIRDQDLEYFKNYDEAKNLLLRDQEIDDLIPVP